MPELDTSGLGLALIRGAGVGFLLVLCALLTRVCLKRLVLRHLLDFLIEKIRACFEWISHKYPDSNYKAIIIRWLLFLLVFALALLRLVL